MAHIALPEGAPGIIGPLTQYPETGQHLLGLAQALLRGPSSLSPAERELIATYVSARNDCTFCMNSHGAAAQCLLDGDSGIVGQVIRDPETASISEKLKALLKIAAKVQISGRNVTDEDVALARATGADDKAIHDTVLIAAAFCMYNRYVDGLATLVPEPGAYGPMGERLARVGYQMR
jgi:uncharacterized peroxidase-related enzyme